MIGKIHRSPQPTGEDGRVAAAGTHLPAAGGEGRPAALRDPEAETVRARQDERPVGPEAAPGRSTAVLVGNPNVGKSVLFKNLTQRYVTVSNFPGTTVEIVRARARNGIELIDTPGLNDLSPRSDDTRVTRRLLATSGDVTVIQVADAKNLRRALLLTAQLAELDLPMVLVLNMSDEMRRRGGRIDVEELERILGIPVVETVAVADSGTDEIFDALQRAAVPRRDFLPRLDEADEYQRNRARLGAIKEILARTWSLTQPRGATLGVRLGFWAMHPVKGVLFLAAVLLAVFWLVGLVGAGTLVDLLEVGVFEQRLNPVAIAAADRLLPFPHHHPPEAVAQTFAVPLTPVHEIALGTSERRVPTASYVLEAEAELTPAPAVRRFFHDFLVGEYGALTMALSYALAIVLPIVTAFFFLFSILEDSGYLPRMAILVNRLFRLMGLNGKAVLPMVLGLGCDTMATMTTRILETRKERIVTTMLLALAVPCSAQLGVLLAMMARLSPPQAMIWLALMVGVIFLIGWLTARLFDGESSDLILEIPPMRRPQLANVAIKTWGRLTWYLREVIPLFVVGTAVLFLLDKLRLLGGIARLGAPLVEGWLGLPREMANALLVGFMRRDFGAVYVLDAATGPEPLLTSHQVLVAMVTITLFMPCFANFLMIAREHGQKVAWAMSAFIFPFAFLVGGLVHRLL